MNASRRRRLRTNQTEVDEISARDCVKKFRSKPMTVQASSILNCTFSNFDFRAWHSSALSLLFFPGSIPYQEVEIVLNNVIKLRYYSSQGLRSTNGAVTDSTFVSDLLVACS